MSSLKLIDGNGRGAAVAEQQFALIERLRQVLCDEHLALQSGDALTLQEIAAGKLRLLKGIDPQARLRMNAAQREKFDAMLYDAMEDNRRNGEFVVAQQNYTRARFAALSSIAGRPNFYNASGSHQLSSRPGYSLGQA